MASDLFDMRIVIHPVADLLAASSVLGRLWAP
jgi:hypothetical protein